MKISPPIEVVASELEAWALEDGWKAVGMAIADEYHAGGGGDILPAVDTGDGLRNAVQRVKRIFRGFYTKICTTGRRFEKSRNSCIAYRTKSQGITST